MCNTVHHNSHVSRNLHPADFEFSREQDTPLLYSSCRPTDSAKFFLSDIFKGAKWSKAKRPERYIDVEPAIGTMKEQDFDLPVPQSHFARTV